MKQEIAMGVSVGYQGVYWAGIAVADWAAIITLVYLMLQIGLLIPKYVKAIQEKAKQKVNKHEHSSEVISGGDR